MYAVIRTGGKQYRVAPDDVIRVEKLSTEAGKSVDFDNVLMIGDGKKTTAGTPLVAGAMVKAEVLENTRGAKIIVFKKKRRKNYRRKWGHRQDLTVLRITQITDADGNTVSGTKAVAKPKAKVKAKAPAKKPAAEPKPKAEAATPAAKPKAAPKAKTETKPKAAAKAKAEPKKKPAGTAAKAGAAKAKAGAAKAKAGAAKAAPRSKTASKSSAKKGGAKEKK